MLITRHTPVHDLIYLYLLNLNIHWFASDTCIHLPVHNSRTIFSLRRNICLPLRLTLTFPFLLLGRPRLSTHCSCSRLLLHLITHTQSVGRPWITDRPVAEASTCKTQHSQGTYIHAPSGIQTRNPSKLAVADPRLKPRGNWDLPVDNSWDNNSRSATS